MRARLLLIEDEEGLVLTLTDRLTSAGFGIEAARSGTEGLHRALEEGPDLVILDLMLPGMDGLEVCRRLREAGVTAPVLMLTARGALEDKVDGFRRGADDYLVKPFAMAELLVRIEALLRRAGRSGQLTREEVVFGDVRVDLRAAVITRAGEPVNCSAREFQLLRFFIEHEGEVLSRDRLLREVWGYGFTSNTRTVDVHIAWLRQKLEPLPRTPRHIITVHGMGYRFVS